MKTAQFIVFKASKNGSMHCLQGIQKQLGALPSRHMKITWRIVSKAYENNLAHCIKIVWKGEVDAVDLILYRGAPFGRSSFGGRRLWVPDIFLNPGGIEAPGH